MARTESTMLPLGTQAPDFSLFEVVHGGPVAPHAVRGARPLLVIFLGRHCPYVLHVAAELAHSAALDAVLTARPIDAEQRPSMGCSIKWQPGRAPAHVAPPAR